ncbi:DUF222 domain-containing protein [Arthrobacter sp. R-11]|uniref:HNH endonuclease signature motif containing protein n=1 Tax=Arthrobacter sp. R-11 TaxID=3404053 RepID=UPI003CF68A64
MEISSDVEVGAPQPDAACDPLRVLDGLVSTLVSVESAIASLQALREYTLALASRVADAMNDGDDPDGDCDGDGGGEGGRPPGFRGVRWDAAELARRAVAAEIATATRAKDRTIQRQMGQAVELLDRFPATFGSLAQGRISLAHARIIQDAGAALDDPDALARYETVLVARAERQAPARVRRLAVREAEKAQPEAMADRHERAAEERRVWVTPLPDGMAELAAVLPAAIAYGIHDRLTRMAQKHAEQHRNTEAVGAAPGRSTDAGRTEPGRGAEPARNTDRLRADLFAELLLCGAPEGHDTPDGLLAAITARADVTVPALTLIGRDGPTAGTGLGGARADATAAAHTIVDNTTPVPAELDGRHPIDPDTARILAGNATIWNRVLTDPVTGAVLAVDRYRPGKALKRLLTARDTRCRFPGCGIPARELDLDHTHDAALDGTTDTGNLAGLCRRHHILKHHSRWKLRQTGAGVLEWTSPTGRTYTDQPPIPPTHIGATSPGSAPGNSPNPPPF